MDKEAQAWVNGGEASTDTREAKISTSEEVSVAPQTPLIKPEQANMDAPKTSFASNDAITHVPVPKKVVGWNKYFALSSVFSKIIGISIIILVAFIEFLASSTGARSMSLTLQSIGIILAIVVWFFTIDWAKSPKNTNNSRCIAAYIFIVYQVIGLLFCAYLIHSYDTYLLGNPDFIISVVFLVVNIILSISGIMELNGHSDEPPLPNVKK